MKKSIAETIQSLRKAKGMTQKDLADQLGISNQAVSKWESGISYPDITLLTDLAHILDTSVDALLSGKKDENEIPPVNGRFINVNPAPVSDMALYEENTQEKTKRSIQTMGFMFGIAAAVTLVLQELLHISFYDSLFINILYIVAAAFLFIPKVENLKLGFLFLIGALVFNVFPRVFMGANLMADTFLLILSESRVFLGLVAAWTALRILRNKYKITVKIKVIVVAVSIIICVGIIEFIYHRTWNNSFGSAIGLYLFIYVTNILFEGCFCALGLKLFDCMANSKTTALRLPTVTKVWCIIFLVLDILFALFWLPQAGSGSVFNLSVSLFGVIAICLTASNILLLCEKRAGLLFLTLICVYYSFLLFMQILNRAQYGYGAQDILNAIALVAAFVLPALTNLFAVRYTLRNVLKEDIAGTMEMGHSQ